MIETTGDPDTDRLLRYLGKTVTLTKSAQRRLGAVHAKAELMDAHGPGRLGVDVHMKVGKPPVRLALRPQDFKECFPRAYEID